ncbi:uncharacterized protein [Nicotiana sylvestris]|uniref:uncharacterized protein n=1 Tax=Nicotiana sylvestris TaxID=4096 RepID=UPI00388C4BA7
MNIPGKFFSWIMACITTVSYTIVVNGKPTRPFDARRGVRQGGSLSPYLFVIAMEYLTRILKTLKEKPDFNYHLRCEKLHIVQLSFADDLLMFYRGDVVSIKLLYECFDQFSKASGRLQLIKSVLFVIQSFWSQIFPLPKKIIQGIETICKRFLWTGETENKAKALVAWKQLCWPKSAGGLNITDILIWNRAVLIKHLWNINKKKDRLWIQWIHTYYIKQQKILGAIKYLNEASIGIEEVMNMREYSIRLVYDKLKGELPKVEWKRLIYCSLCGRATESHDHLFLKCNYSTVIWRKLLQWLGITRDVQWWNDEIQWAERNWRTFRGTQRSCEELIRMIVQEFVQELKMEDEEIGEEE